MKTYLQACSVETAKYSAQKNSILRLASSKLENTSECHRDTCLSLCDFLASPRVKFSQRLQHGSTAQNADPFATHLVQLQLSQKVNLLSDLVVCWLMKRRSRVFCHFWTSVFERSISTFPVEKSLPLPKLLPRCETEFQDDNLLKIHKCSQISWSL